MADEGAPRKGAFESSVEDVALLVDRDLRRPRLRERLRPSFPLSGDRPLPRDFSFREERRLSFFRLSRNPMVLRSGLSTLALSGPLASSTARRTMRVK